MALVVKNPLANAGDTRDMGSIPGSGRSPGVGNGNSLQYSCLENSMTEETGGPQATGLQRVEHDWTIKHTHTLIPYLCLIVFSLECLKGFLPLNGIQGFPPSPCSCPRDQSWCCCQGLRYKVLVGAASTSSLAAGTIYLNTPETHCTNAHCSGMLESQQWRPCGLKCPHIHFLQISCGGST